MPIERATNKATTLDFSLLASRIWAARTLVKLFTDLLDLELRQRNKREMSAASNGTVRGAAAAHLVLVQHHGRAQQRASQLPAGPHHTHTIYQGALRYAGCSTVAGVLHLFWISY